MTEPAAKHCPFCEKKGLPILPLRPAVARRDMEDLDPAALDLPDTLGTALTDVALPANSAKYTARLLRAGYLYAFNEVRGEWAAYVVTDLGYLYEFDAEDITPPDADKIEFTCFRTGEEYIARCISIPDAKNAGALWLAFSDTAWTPAVLDRHRKQAYRERHMTRVDVGQWANGNTNQANTAPFDQLKHVVNEMTVVGSDKSRGIHAVGKTLYYGKESGELQESITLMSRVTAVAHGYAFSHSPYDFAPCGQEADGLLEWATRVGEKVGAPPMLVAVNDPVGVTAELGMLMASRLREHLTAADCERPLAVSAAIGNIRHFIQEDAENRQYWQSERDARNAVDPGYMGMGDGGGGARAGMALAELWNPELKERREAYIERWRNPSPAEITQARADAWARYKKKFNHIRLSNWETQWNARTADLDRTVIKPLAEAHVQWMQSGALVERLHCSCDESDIQSGKGFVDTLLMCIQNTQEYTPCNQLYARWLAATRIERSNLALLAMGYNQKALLEPLKEVSEGGLSPDLLKTLPWDGLIAGYDGAVEALGDGGSNSVVRLAAALGGPIADVAGKAVDHMIGPGLVMLGVIAKAPVIAVDVTMSKANAIAELTARMMAVNPKLTELGDLNRAIELQMRKAKVYGTSVNAKGHFRYLIMAHPQVVEDFPGVDAHGNARHFAERALLTPADRDRMTRLRWNKLLPGAAGLGIIAGCLQIAALTKLADDVDKSMAHEANENQWRYHTALAGLAGTLADTSGKWSESAATTGSRWAVRIERTLGRWLRMGGKALGIGAGVVMAVWDFYRGWNEFQEGNAWIGVGMVASGIFSIFAMAAFSGWAASLLGAALATGIGIVLVVLVIAIAVLIEVFKDNKLQDWLERCYFGTFEAGQRYADPELELKELKIALEG